MSLTTGDISVQLLMDCTVTLQDIEARITEDRRAVHRHLERLGLRVHVNGADRSLGLQIGSGKTSWQPLHGELAVSVLKKGLNGVFYLPATPEEAEREATALMADGPVEPRPCRLVAPAEGWSDIEPGTYSVQNDGCIYLKRNH